MPKNDNIYDRFGAAESLSWDELDSKPVKPVLPITQVSKHTPEPKEARKPADHSIPKVMKRIHDKVESGEVPTELYFHSSGKETRSFRQRSLKEAISSTLSHLALCQAYGMV